MHEYQREDEEILFNQHDPDLGGRKGEFAIRVQMPTLESFYDLPREEAIKKVLGYGLEPKKQKFDYYRDVLKSFKTPPKIDALIDKLTEDLTRKHKKPTSPEVEQINDELEGNPTEYKEEILWIMREKNRSFSGMFLFIKGKVTYITGDHYTYLTGAEISNPFRHKQGDTLPFYRDIDRRTYIFAKWAATTTEATFKYKISGRRSGEFEEEYFNDRKAALRYAKNHYSFYDIEEGQFNKEMGKRTSSGMVWAARRGGGKTYIMGHIGTKIAMNTRNGRFVIQARSETTAKDDVYMEKVRQPFETLPFWNKPCNQIQEGGIRFYPKNKSALSHETQRHNGRIFVRSSANTAVDGNRVHAYGNDESGKDAVGNVLSDYNGTVKKMISISEEIIGFAMYFSTFGQFDKGGKAFFDLFKASISHQRNDLGRTRTGLIAYFTPAYDGYDDCIDEYGYSIIEDPTEPYFNMKGVEMKRGAKSILTINREQWREAGNSIQLSEEIRDNAWTIREASRPAVTTESWNMKIIDERIEYLEFDEQAPKPRLVNLEWVGGSRSMMKEKDGKLVNSGQLAGVKIVDDPNGRWKLHNAPPDEWRNKKQYEHFTGQWGPDPNFKYRHVIGSDPFAFDKKDTTSKAKNLSSGGGLVFRKRDFNFDPDDTNIRNWTSYTSAATYLYRPDTTDEYCEDMLKACVLWSSMISTERNVPHIIKKFREWNCMGYLLHLTDPITGELDPVPGFRTQGEAKQDLFALVRDYVNNHGHREESLELLYQIRATETFDDLTDNDLVAALGGALKGAESRMYETMGEDSDMVDMSGYATYT